MNGMLGALKRTAATLRNAGVPFAVAGGLACWARGAPVRDDDVDIVVTKDDLARVEARIEEVRASAANAATPTTAAAAKPAAAKAAARPTAAKATKPPKPVEPVEPATTTKSAGISRSGSVRKRPGGTSSGGSARSKG